MPKVFSGDGMDGQTRIRTEILKRGIKQEWIAAQTGIPSNTISRIVRGQLPTLRHAQKLARVLGLTVDDLWPLEEGE